MVANFRCKYKAHHEKCSLGLDKKRNIIDMLQEFGRREWAPSYGD